MEYKILESTGVEITHVDGAAFNNFSSGGKSGILPEVLDECRAIALTSDTVQISTGELLIKGFRVKITSPYIITKPPNIVDSKYYLIAKIKLDPTGIVSFVIEARQDDNLTQEDLFKVGRGIYEIELCRFVVGSSGITNLFQTAEVISIGTNKSDIPISIKTEFEMTTFLESSEVGSVVKYVGESGEVYEQGALYIVEAVSE